MPTYNRRHPGRVGAISRISSVRLQMAGATKQVTWKRWRWLIIPAGIVGTLTGIGAADVL